MRRFERDGSTMPMRFSRTRRHEPGGTDDSLEPTTTNVWWRCIRTGPEVILSLSRQCQEGRSSHHTEALCSDRMILGSNQSDWYQSESQRHHRLDLMTPGSMLRLSFHRCSQNSRLHLNRSLSRLRLLHSLLQRRKLDHLDHHLKRLAQHLSRSSHRCQSHHLESCWRNGMR